MEEIDALMKAIILPDTRIDQTPEPVDIVGEFLANARFGLGELATSKKTDSDWTQQVGPARVAGDSLEKRVKLSTIARVERTVNGSGDTWTKEFDSRGELISAHIEDAGGDARGHLAKAHQQPTDQHMAGNNETPYCLVLEKIKQVLDLMPIVRPSQRRLVDTKGVPPEFVHFVTVDEG